MHTFIKHLKHFSARGADEKDVKVQDFIVDGDHRQSVLRECSHQDGCGGGHGHRPVHQRVLSDEAVGVRRDVVAAEARSRSWGHSRARHWQPVRVEAVLTLKGAWKRMCREC